MESKYNRKLAALAKQPFKIIGAVSTPTSLANTKIYYVKPSVPCKLIGAKLHVLTADGANLASAALLTKETGVTDKNLPFDKLTMGSQFLTASPYTSVTLAVTPGSAVSNDDFMQFAVASVATAKVSVAGLLGANYAGSENSFDPKNNDALLFTMVCANNVTVLDAQLELEFIPL